MSFEAHTNDVAFIYDSGTILYDYARWRAFGPVWYVEKSHDQHLIGHPTRSSHERLNNYFMNGVPGRFL